MKTQEKESRISEMEFNQHDCHLTAEDGCPICEKYAEEKLVELMVCPHGMCDGSGYYEEGQFDEFYTVKCLCQIEREQDNDQDQDDF